MAFPLCLFLQDSVCLHLSISLPSATVNVRKVKSNPPGLSEPWKCRWTQVWAVWYTHKCSVESREDWNYHHACFFSFISSSHCRNTNRIAVSTLKYFTIRQRNREKPRTQPCEAQYFHFMVIKLFVRVLILHLHKINICFNSIKDGFLVKISNESYLHCKFLISKKKFENKVRN